MESEGSSCVCFKPCLEVGENGAIILPKFDQPFNEGKKLHLFDQERYMQSTVDLDVLGNILKIIEEKMAHETEEDTEGPSPDSPLIHDIVLDDSLF